MPNLKGAFEGKKKFVEWTKCKKCGCKYLADQIYKHANKKYNKCYKKEHIFRFYNSYISLNNWKTLEKSTTFNSDSKKNISCVTEIVANKIFETSIAHKIIVDLGIT